MNMMNKISGLPGWHCAAVCFALLVCFSSLSNALRQRKIRSDDDCEVCVKFVRRFMDNMKEAYSLEERSKEDLVKREIKKDCKNRKNKDERFCYKIGAKEDSATSQLKEFMRPVSYGMDPERVCEKLSGHFDDICELRYDKTIDLAAVNFKKLKVKDLKKILSDWDETCRGCTEKSDYISKIKELIPKYAPEAAKKLEEREEL